MSIFTSLEKYTGENFLTQCLAEVIQHLLRVPEDREVGIELLNMLCGISADHYFEESESIHITTQHTIETGILDLRIVSDDKEIYVEVKDMSAVDLSQLRKYKTVVTASSAPNTGLVLLTRFSIPDTDHQNIPDKLVLWREFHSWVKKAKCSNPISEYLIHALQTFLEDKQMSIERVTWEYEQGVLALNNLMQMIEIAIAEVKSRGSRGSGRSRVYTGIFFENNDFWCGIGNLSPLVLIFQIEKFQLFEKNKLRKHKRKILENDDGALYFELHLDEIHFFSLEANKQVETVNQFVKESYVDAQIMRNNSFFTPSFHT